MKDSDVTFIFTVGGSKNHYDNMERCIRSIEAFYPESKFLIIEFGNKLQTKDNKEIVNLENVIDFNAGKKVGYLIWKHKYVGALMVKTKYGVYVDTDTVLVNPTIHQILETVSGGIGVTRHFWVPNIDIYQNRACDQTSIFEFLKIKEKLDLKNESLFFAGGVFLFENNDAVRSIFQEVLRMYDEHYTGKDYIKSITDELFLASALNKNSEITRILGGALNHCSMGDENMPLISHDNILYGRNSFENEWQPITFLHCDTSRRDPSISYTGKTRELVRQAFEMIV